MPRRLSSLRRGCVTAAPPWQEACWPGSRFPFHGIPAGRQLLPISATEVGAKWVLPAAAGYASGMQIDKSQILELLRNMGDHNKAQEADQQLPDQVDTEQHAGLLQKLGINPADLLKGGGGLGGLLGR